MADNGDPKNLAVLIDADNTSSRYLTTSESAPSKPAFRSPPSPQCSDTPTSTQRQSTPRRRARSRIWA